VKSACHRFRLGRFRILIAKDGTGDPRPLSDLVEEVPPDLFGREIFMEGGLMVVDAPEGRLLVDAGNGPSRGPREHAAEAAFAREDITADSITTVLLTHGDPDHIGGLLTGDGDLVYPNADYVLSTGLWQALRSDPRDGLYFPGQAESIAQLAPLIQDRCTLFDTENEIWPGIRGIPAPGHRAGHAIYRFSSQGALVYHIGDAAFDPLFLERPELMIPSEHRPEEARATRRWIARRAASENALVVGSHFAVANVGRLQSTSTENRYRWIPQTARLARDPKP